MVYKGQNKTKGGVPVADDNLIPFNERTEEEQRNIATMGGIASGKARKRKKQMHEMVQIMLNSKVTEEQSKELVRQFPDLTEEDATIASSMIAGQIKSAMNGNTKAFMALNELNEKGQGTDDHTSWCLPITDTTIDYVEAYRTVHEAYETGNVREIISKGGRGSIKSNFWSAVAEETIYQDPQAHVVMTRRYKTDLRGSVYNQFVKTVTRHGKLEEWEFTTSPMEATLKATGQKVIFVGCDKPISLKSYNMPFGYVKLLIHEECDEMAGVEQMDNVEDTFLRNDTPALDVKVFNPPESINNFMNKYAQECLTKEGTKVFHSYYYNVPVKWLGQRFFDRAKWFKENKPRYYDNNYLGKVTGTGGIIFDNIEVRTITDEEMATLDRRYRGLDFGFEHPQVLMEMNYDDDIEVLYLTDEVWRKRSKQETFARACNKYKRVEIIADSANPDKIQDWQDYGFDIIPATKRWKGGGRDNAWEWLRTRNKIVIDPERTPHALKEFTTLEFEKLKDGTFSSAYPRLEEDCVMACAYGMNRVIMSEKTYLYEEE